MTVVTPAYLQNKAYGARADRQVLGDQFQPGVLNSAGLKVSASGSVARGINVASGTGYVLGSSALQGLYRAYNDATVSLVLDASVTNPRIDQVILRIQDSQENGNVGPDIGTIEIVKGTEASGATLDNRNGAVNVSLLGYNYLLLSDVLVTVGMGIIPAGNVRDRRTWARGASYATTKSDANIAVIPAGAQAFHARLELLSPLLEVSFGGSAIVSGSGSAITTVLWFEGVSSVPLTSVYHETLSGAVIRPHVFSSTITVPPAARNKSVRVYLHFSGSNGGIVYASGTDPFHVSYREVVLPSATND